MNRWIDGHSIDPQGEMYLQCEIKIHPWLIMKMIYDFLSMDNLCLPVHWIRQDKWSTAHVWPTGRLCGICTCEGNRACLGSLETMSDQSSSFSRHDCWTRSGGNRQKLNVNVMEINVHEQREITLVVNYYKSCTHHEISFEFGSRQCVSAARWRCVCMRVYDIFFVVVFNTMKMKCLEREKKRELGDSESLCMRVAD